MKISAILSDSTAITKQQLVAGYNYAARSVSLQPVIVTVKAGITGAVDLSTYVFNLDNDITKPVIIKEIADIIAAARVESLPEISGSSSIQLEYGITAGVSGAIYYSNNIISATSVDTVFLMVCYLIPVVSDDEDSDDDIPDHLVMLSLAKAHAIMSTENGDDDSSGRYDALFTQLANLYNMGQVSIENKSSSVAAKVVPYAL